MTRSLIRDISTAIGVGLLFLGAGGTAFEILPGPKPIPAVITAVIGLVILSIVLFMYELEKKGN